MRVRQVAGAAVRAGLWVVAVAALAPSVAVANDSERSARISYFEPLHALPSPAGNAERKSGGAVQQLSFDAFGRRFSAAAISSSRDLWHAARKISISRCACSSGPGD